MYYIHLVAQASVRKNGSRSKESEKSNYLLHDNSQCGYDIFHHDAFDQSIEVGVS